MTYAPPITNRHPVATSIRMDAALADALKTYAIQRNMRISEAARECIALGLLHGRARGERGGRHV